MKILILCKKFPYPLKEGEPIAVSYLSKSLSENGCSISLLVLNTSKHYFNPSELPANKNHYHIIFDIPINNEINLKGALKSILKNESYLLSRFYSKEYEEKLIEILNEEDYDVVQLETIYMAHYIKTIKQNSSAIVALRSHNVEHQIWKKVALMSKNILKKWYLNYQNKSLKKFELCKINESDILVSITDKDLNSFKKMGFEKESIAIPVGFNSEQYQTDFLPTNEKKTIAFIGALDWMPNQDGVLWFLNNIWPVIKKEIPDLEFHIAGKNTPSWIKKLSKGGVVVHGEVPDAKNFITKHPVLIAPLFSGSGIKIKVLEGMALGRAVITTAIGVEGIPAIHEKHLFVASTKKDFITAIKNCFSDNIELVKIRRNSRELIDKKFDGVYLAQKLKNAYQKLIDKKK